MSTRTTGKRERFLEDRQLDRERYKPNLLYTIDHIRAEYDGLIRRLAAKKRGKLGENAIWDHGYRKALNDVLAIIKERKK